MNLKNNKFAHRLRKKFIIGSNLIMVIGALFYILVRMAVRSGSLNFSYWPMDMNIASVGIICLLVWQLYITLIR